MRDFQQLQMNGWVYWQIFDATKGYGVFQHNVPIAGLADDSWGEDRSRWHVSEKYHLLAQFTRHIRPGMTIDKAYQIRRASFEPTSLTNNAYFDVKSTRTADTVADLALLGGSSLMGFLVSSLSSMLPGAGGNKLPFAGAASMMFSVYATTFKGRPLLNKLRKKFVTSLPWGAEEGADMLVAHDKRTNKKTLVVAIYDLGEHMKRLRLQLRDMFSGRAGAVRAFQTIPANPDVQYKEVDVDLDSDMQLRVDVQPWSVLSIDIEDLPQP